MTQLFKAVLSISISGAVLALFLLGLRSVLLGKIRPYAYIILWGILALRLLLPFTIESRLSIYNYAPDQVQEMVALVPFAALSQTETDAPRAALVPESAAKARLTPSPALLPEAPHSPAAAPQAEAAKGSFDPWLTASYIWAFGLCALLFYMVFLNIAYHFRIKKNRRYSSKSFADALVRAKENTGIKTDIAAYAAGSLASPSVFGLLRPKLLIPFKTFEHLSEKQQEYILTHELFHIRFGDNWAVLLMNIICAVHWFNPVVWLARHMARKDLELMCDARTLKAVGGRGEDYAGALISTAEKLRSRGRTSLMIAAVDKKRDIRWRIKMVMKQKGVKTSLSVVSCFLAVAIAAAGCTSAVQGSIAVATKGQSPTPAISPAPAAPSKPSDDGSKTELETLPLPEGYSPLEMPESASVFSQVEYENYPNAEKWAFTWESILEGHGYALEDIARAIWSEHNWEPSENNITEDNGMFTALLSDDAGSAESEQLHMSDYSIYYYTNAAAKKAFYGEEEAAKKAQEWMKGVLGDIPLLETAPENAGIWPHMSLYWVLEDKNELGQMIRRETLSTGYSGNGITNFNYYIEAAHYDFQPIEGVALTLEQALHSFNYQRAVMIEKSRSPREAFISESLRISDISLDYRPVYAAEEAVVYFPHYLIECLYDEEGYDEPLHAYFLMNCQTGNLQDSADYTGNAYDYYGNLLLLSPYPQINGHEQFSGKEKDAVSVPAPGGGSPLTIADAAKMAEGFDNLMNLSLYTMESPELPDYVIDNVSVHLYMRWFDYRIAMLEHPYNSDERYAEPSGAEANLTLKEYEEGRALYELSLLTHQKRLNNGVNGVYLLGEIEFMYQDGSWKISEFDIERGLHRVFETLRGMVVGQSIATTEGVDRLIDAQIDYFKKNN